MLRLLGTIIAVSLILLLVELAAVAALLAGIVLAVGIALQWLRRLYSDPRTRTREDPYD